ncbi:MAG TPA: ribose-phosphate pyrophosphokinase [Anaerolineae bacterium]|nr:ribose-phosphate pyrophosphokinase [Anaerolineae bacterium]
MDAVVLEQAKMDSVRVFSGSAHVGLAKEICDSIGVPLLPSVTRHFSNDCLYVHLGVSVREKEVFIIQPLSPPVNDHLMELLMMVDTARHASARRIHAVIPYYAYARSDKKDEPRISVTGRLVADLLRTAGASHVITMTLHSPQVHGFFTMPVDHLTSQSVFINHFRKRDLGNTVVVSPDIGHAKRAAKLARALNVPLAAANKERLTDEQVAVSAIIGDVRGKDVIIHDDEVATAGTLIKVIEVLLRKGIGRLTVACTHGVFSGPAIDRLRAIPEIEEIVTTNTVPMPAEKLLPNMTVLSVASIFGEAIRCNILGRSVGKLFAFWLDEQHNAQRPANISSL